MLAGIDVGSNTVRMLLGRVEQGRLIPIRYERAITRLGGNFHRDRGLAPESMQRTLLALMDFADILAEQAPQATRMVGTAALRRAANRDRFIRMVAETTGLQLEVIDGRQEARLSALGVLEALAPRPKAALIIDIGGGSTELVLLKGRRVRFRESYPLGVVRLCEESGDETARIEAIAEVVVRFENALSRAGLSNLIRSDNCEFVGTAGTVTTLAALDQRMAEYDWRRVNNYLLSLETLQQHYARLAALTVAQREQLPGLEAGRGDLILPGIEILLALAKCFARPHVRVSDFGLLEGLLLDLSSSGSD